MPDKQVIVVCWFYLTPYTTGLSGHVVRAKTDSISHVGRAATVMCSVQFLKVWGAAEATCERWYAAGCRTLDDLRARTDLSEQQVESVSDLPYLQCCTGSQYPFSYV